MRRHLAFLAAMALALAARIHASDTGYLFTYFIGNGEDGLHLAMSDDGLSWKAVADGKSLLRPAIGTKEKLMRDPCVARGPDGTYHIVWTSGWWERGIGYASTRDFIHWSEQKEIPVMAQLPARNAWAPELVWDDAAKEFVIFWSSTVEGAFPETANASEDGLNHRIYATRTRDFNTFTETKLFSDPGFSCIDATYVRFDSDLWWVIKDETKFPVAKKHLRAVKVGEGLAPVGKLSAPFSPVDEWVEGPTGLQIGEHAYVYFDIYKSKRYGVMRTKDFVSWEDMSAQLVLPNEGTRERVRHGTIISVPRGLLRSLQEGSHER